MKRMISLLLFVALCWSLFPGVHADNQVDGYSDAQVQEIYNNYQQTVPTIDYIISNKDNLGYWMGIRNLNDNGFLTKMLNFASGVVEETPDKKRYAEMLITLIVMQEGTLSEAMQNQQQYDQLKTGGDYVWDAVEAASSFLGAQELGEIEDYLTVGEAVQEGAETLSSQLGSAEYYSMTVQDYSQAEAFLKIVVDYTDNEELKATAETLRGINKSLLDKRFDYIQDSLGSLAEYEAEFFFKEMSFAILKETDTYLNDETARFIIDCGEKLQKALERGTDLFNFVFKMMMIIGDVGFGTTNTFNRYQEMKTMSEIADAIVRAKDEATIADPSNLTAAYRSIRKRCGLLHMLMIVHARGEYLNYQLIDKDAGLISDINWLVKYFSHEEGTEAWFNSQRDALTRYANQIDSVFRIIGETVFNGHRYRLFEESSVVSWEDAQQFCADQGGHLATITSAEENRFLVEYILSLGHTAAYFGYSDADSEGHWRWENDEQTNYANWFEGEPNNDKNGENYALFYHADQTDQWNDGDFGVLSEGGRAFICEWDDLNRSPAETQTPVQTEAPTSPVSEERDVVLVLDTSGSMSGDPMSETKKAAVKFVQTVLPQNAGVGIVTFDSSASVVSGFSRDERALTDAINDIYDGGATNTEAGLSTAYDMLRQSNANKRIIVLMSDGMPNNGRGGQDLIDYANSIKSDDVYVYTLGFFSELSEGEKISAQSLMEGIASDGCHYEVANADDLVFFFNDIADQINGQKYIYVRIACPVDVSVFYNGQHLNSAEDALSLRTDFGTLTFEQNEVSEENPDQDDRVKVLRLKEGADYDVQIEGTGRGVMEYTIGFMDEDGKYSDFRTFRNVRITEQTMIDTVATVSEESILNVDEDGDGKYDVRYSAEANGYGKEIKTSKLPYIVIGADAMFAIVIILIILIRNHKNNKGKVSY